MASSSQKIDQRKLCDALQVTDKPGLWTVIVQVLIKYPTKGAQANPNMLYKKFLFTDMKGTRISAITFSAIEHFDRIFEPFKRYYITNASVKLAEPKYRIGDYNYTWYLYPRTHVQLLHDPVPHVIPCSFEFMKFSEMFTAAERAVSIDVKALVVHSYPVPHATKPFVRDYILIDEEMRPMILRVWEDLLREHESGIANKLPKPTPFVGIDLKVTTHNGLSLTTSFNPCFMINPPLHRNEPLLAWYNEHADQIALLLQQEAYKSTSILLPPPAATHIVPIRDVTSSMEKVQAAWISGTIHLMPAQERLWHTICDKCKKTVNLPVGWNLACMYCNKQMNVEPRCHVHVFLNDASGTLSATLFSSTAENFIGFTAAELVESDEKNTPLTDEIARKIDKKSVVCFLKYYDNNNFRNKTERTYSVVTLYTEDELNQAATQASSSITAHEIETSLQHSPAMDSEKEKQLFSPSTKKVIEEIAVTTGLLKGTMLRCPPTKRAIMFTDISDENQHVLLPQLVPPPVQETDAPSLGKESPVKKIKNKQAEERSGH